MSPEVLGTFATITSLVFMAMGLPVQILKIYKAKSTEGISLFTQCTLFLTTLSWCVYSLKISNLYILVANAPGALFALIILVQFWIYRSHRTQSVQGFSVNKSEMDHIRTRGDIWLNRRMFRPPFKGERMQVSSDNDVLMVSVIEFRTVGDPDDGNYRMHVQKN